MKSGTLLLLVVALLVLFAGGAAVVVVVNREKMAQLLRDAFARHGLDPTWGEAFGVVESNLNPKARNESGPDATLGGSYGATQMSRVLLSLAGGPTPEELLQDPALQAEWTARLVSEGAAVHFVHGSPVLVRYGSPASLEDAGAVWNAGRQTFAELPVSHVTRTSYVPKLLAAAADASDEVSA